MSLVFLDELIKQKESDSHEAADSEIQIDDGSVSLLNKKLQPSDLF